MGKLSPHFSLDELTFSQTAVRKGIDNDPPADVLERLTHTAAQMEKVRALLGGLPIHVSSGYRSPRLNRAIGGAAKSHHVLGCAVDFTCRAFGSPLEVCQRLAASDLQFDQLIEEHGRWTHISFAPPLRRQILTYRNGRYTPGLRA